MASHVPTNTFANWLLDLRFLQSKEKFISAVSLEEIHISPKEIHRWERKMHISSKEIHISPIHLCISLADFHNLFLPLHSANRGFHRVGSKDILHDPLS